MFLRKQRPVAQGAPSDDPAAEMLVDEVQRLLSVIADLRAQPAAPYTVAELDRLEDELRRLTEISGAHAAG